MAKEEQKSGRSRGRGPPPIGCWRTTKARRKYEILETLETGIELVGTEVKSIRNGKANLRDGFCLIPMGNCNYNVPSPHPRRQLLQPRSAAHPKTAGHK